MEEVVKKIIEIEHEAQSLVAEGLARKDMILKDTQEELKRMEENILEMSDHKIEQLNSRNIREKEDKVLRIYEHTALKMRMMEELLEEKQELWEDQIFNRIIGR